MAQYNDWLNALANAGLRDDLPPMMKGVGFGVIWEAAEHPILGNWEDGTWLMEVRAAPISSSPVLATFTVTSGESVSLINPVAMDLPVSEHDDITEPAAPGVTKLFFTTLYASPGGSFELVRGGLLPVLSGGPAA